MDLSELITAAGGCLKPFSAISRITIRLYDRKGAELTTFPTFEHPLFMKNRNEQLRFFQYLHTLETNPDAHEGMKVQIGDKNVVMNYQTPKAQLFWRE